MENREPPLFEAYPGLRTTLPHQPLGALPTPVERMEKLERALAGKLGDALTGTALFVKRDDVSGKPYGGNKVRKLEFLLARAVADQRKTIITFGAAGSNHALATAIYARQLGLRAVSMLVPQPNAHSVRRNLLMSRRAGAEIHYGRNMSHVAAQSLVVAARCTLRDGRWPFLIPPGGSSPLGVVGFVNAAFELKQQIEAGALPEPDVLYAASGTMGTVVGLCLGLCAAGLRTRVEAVRVTAAQFTSIDKARRLFQATNVVLRRADPAFPVFEFPEDRFAFRHEFYGQQYAMYTDEGVRAVRQVKETEGLKIEGTYTGKTFAAILADAERGLLRGRTILFWNTYNSFDFSREVEHDDYHLLPKALHRYFEEDVQPLDR